MNDQMYALRLDDINNMMVLISEYGPSDDPLTLFYLYEEGQHSYVGDIVAKPDNRIIYVERLGFARHKKTLCFDGIASSSAEEGA